MKRGHRLWAVSQTLAALQCTAETTKSRAREGTSWIEAVRKHARYTSAELLGMHTSCLPANAFLPHAPNSWLGCCLATFRRDVTHRGLDVVWNPLLCKQQYALYFGQDQGKQFSEPSAKLHEARACYNPEQKSYNASTPVDKHANKWTRNHKRANAADTQHSKAVYGCAKSFPLPTVQAVMAVTRRGRRLWQGCVNCCFAKCDE